MSLNKEKLIEELEDGLIIQGFVQFKESLLGASGFFVKKIHPDFYLSLGLEISRYDEDHLTGSFYLSKTTCWFCTWGDIPKNSYKTIGSLLNDKEKIKLLGEEHEPVMNVWWDANSQNAFNNFLKTIQIAEINFITPELVQSINESSDVSVLHGLAQAVIAKVIQKKNIQNLKFQCTPSKLVDDIPKIWFQTAEAVLIENKVTINQNKVRLLASDAYRIYTLNK